MSYYSTLMQIRRRQITAALAGTAPSWVLRGRGAPARLDIDFVNDLAYNNGPTTIGSIRRGWCSDK